MPDFLERMVRDAGYDTPPVDGPLRHFGPLSEQPRDNSPDIEAPELVEVEQELMQPDQPRRSDDGPAPHSNDWEQNSAELHHFNRPNVEPSIVPVVEHQKNLTEQSETLNKTASPEAIIVEPEHFSGDQDVALPSEGPIVRGDTEGAPIIPENLPEISAQIDSEPLLMSGSTDQDHPTHLEEKNGVSQAGEGQQETIILSATRIESVRLDPPKLTEESPSELEEPPKVIIEPTIPEQKIRFPEEKVRSDLREAQISQDKAMPVRERQGRIEPAEVKSEPKNETDSEHIKPPDEKVAIETRPVIPPDPNYNFRAIPAVEPGPRFSSPRETAQKEPSIHIGQVDIFIEEEAPQRTSTANPAERSPSIDVSALFWRRL